MPTDSSGRHFTYRWTQMQQKDGTTKAVRVKVYLPAYALHQNPEAWKREDPPKGWKITAMKRKKALQQAKS